MDFSTIPSIQAALKAKEAYRTATKSVGTGEISAAAKLLFAAHPELDAVQWDQFTPGFADGDPCTFRVYDLKARAAAAVADGDEDFLWSYELDGTPIESARDALQAFESFLQEIEDVLRELFGDGYTVTLTRAGIDIDDCYHD